MTDKLLIAALKNHKVGVLPTDTVYGLVGLLFSPKAVQRIYDIKQRDLTKPVGTILIADVNQIQHLTKPALLARAARHWPGPVSVILPLREGMGYAHKGYNSLPFRIPDDQDLLTLLRAVGPLATSSANIEGSPFATNLKQAKTYFADLPDFYIDGGDLSDHQPSKIIRLCEDGTEEQIR